jgi:acyl dehydratase
MEVGAESSLQVDVSPADVRAFIALSGDDAPLHTDADFAVRQGFRGPLVHGALLAAYVSRFIGTVLPGPYAVLTRMDIQFRRPCYAPCTLRIDGRIRQVSDAVNGVVMEFSIQTGDGEPVASAKTFHSILKTA